MDLSAVAVLCLAAFAAGTLDAIVGGGGLIQLPALLLVLPGYPVVALLGTNKLASVVGTGSAAVTYARRVTMDRARTVQMCAAAFAGSLVGAGAATQAGSELLRPIVLLALVAVWLYTLRRPQLGEVELIKLTGQHHTALAVVGGAVIGAYDGFVGPGTGNFLIFLLVGGVGLSFLHASATAKAVNTTTNLAALLLFGLGGHVLWGLGALMALANLAGAQIGARLAIRRGSGWVRAVFLIVVAALIISLAYDVLT